MSTIDDLVTELCSAGIEWKKIGDVIAKNPFRQLGAGQLEVLVDESGKGDVKLLPSSRNYDWWTTEEKAGTYLCEGEVITLGRARYANIKYHKGKFVSSNNHIITSKDTTIVLNRFLYHYISGHVDEFYVPTSTYPKLDNAIFNNHKMPAPPIEVQNAIVEILDSFVELERTLEKELLARKKQFDYYRDELFAFAADENIKWMPLGDVGEFIRGKRFTKEDYADDGVGVIHYGEIYTHYGTSAENVISHVRKDLASKLRYAKPGDVVLTDVGETVEDVGKAVAWMGKGEVAIHDHCYAFRHNMNPKFVSYYMQTTKFEYDKAKYIARTKVNTLLIKGFAKVNIPVPSMAEQNRIVSILDGFDKLLNDSSVGLPAEISARHKQYEYYRDKLLTFQELAV